MKEFDATPNEPRAKRNRRSRVKDSEGSSPPAKGWLRKRRLWIALGLFLLALYLVPNLASFRTVRGWLVDSVSEGYPVTIVVDEASVGWFSPIVLTGVHVADLEGEPLLDAARITCRSSLSSLMFNSKAPGVVVIEQPVVQVRLSQDSSNWEEVLAQMPPSEEPLDLDAALEIVDGAIAVDDRVSGRQSRIDQVEGRIDYPRGVSVPLAIQLTAAVAGHEQAKPGSLAVEGEWYVPLAGPDGPAADWGSGSMSLTVEGIPLEVASPILRRADVAASASGVLNAQVTAERSNEGGPLVIHVAALNAEQLQVMEPTALAEPAIALRNPSLEGVFEVSPNAVQWRGMQFNGDLGRVASVGGIHFKALAESNYDAAFASHPLHLEGRIDISALASMLPETLAIRNDIRLRSGELTFHVDNGLAEHSESGKVVKPAPGTPKQWRGTLNVSEIEAVSSSGQVHSIPPARVSLVATSTESGITLDHLEGQGEFFALRGRGDLAQGQLTGSVSLDDLQRELEQVIDLRGTKLAGEAQFQANWSRGEQDRWTASGSANMTDWQLTLPQRGVWREDDLRLTASAEGIMSEGALEQLQQAQVQITADADVLSAQLQSSVDLTSDSPKWPVRYTLQGDAARWQTRLATVVPTPGVRVDGQLNAEGSLVVGSHQVAWRDLRLHAEPLQISTAALFINEPVTDIDSSGVFTWGASALTVRQLRLVSTSVSANAQGIQANFAAAQPVATGQVAFRGDWSRIGRWFATAGVDQLQPQWRMEGTFEGSAQLAAQGDTISGTLTVVNDDTAFYRLQPPANATRLASANVPQWELAWQEPQATINGKLSYQPAAGTVLLENLSVDSKMLQLAMAGNVSDLGGIANADLRGTIQYDLAKLSTLLQPRLGSSFHMEGVKKSEFYLRGPIRSDLTLVSVDSPAASSARQPLVSPRLEAAGGVAWDSARLYGLPVGPGQFAVHLQQSVLQIAPIDVPVSQGRLQVNSKISLFEPTPTLFVAKGRVIDNVEITPEMCHDWLRYVAPLMADVTRVEGKLALDLNDSQIPLGSPHLANTSGSLAVSNAQVGPGPLSEAVIFIARRIQSIVIGQPLQAADPQTAIWVNVPQQRIPFAIRDGRVYHENMQTHVGAVQIITHGSVGFDQTLQLTADVPIRPEWFQNRQGLLASLQGRTLQIPVTGTLTQPQIDSQIMEQLARQGLQGAANDLINEGLRRGFNRFFGPAPE